jgi:hypothetical protein
MTAIIQHADLPNNFQAFCLPQSFDVRLAARAFAQIVDNTAPEHGNDPAGTGVLAYFTAAFPCSPKQ